MTMTSIAPIKRGLVRALRANATLKAAVHNEIHESFAPEEVEYPFITYSFAYAPYEYAWGSAMIRAGVDVYVFHRDQVEAQNLDQLVIEAVQGTALNLDSSGQTSLLARRVSDQSSAFLDDGGTRVYQVGGTFELWTDQTT